jgi:hypothetical protein
MAGNSHRMDAYPPETASADCQQSLMDSDSATEKETESQAEAGEAAISKRGQ